MAPLFSKIYQVVGEEEGALVAKRPQVNPSKPHPVEIGMPIPRTKAAPPPHPGEWATSQTCTQGYWAPRSSVTEAHTSMTARISGIDMSGSVTSDQGWKHKTLLSSEGGRDDRNTGLGCARGRAQPQCLV